MPRCAQTRPQAHHFEDEARREVLRDNSNMTRHDDGKQLEVNGRVPSEMAATRCDWFDLDKSDGRHGSCVCSKGSNTH